MNYKPQVNAEAYEKHAFHPLRIESITEQLRQICYSDCTNILEVGVGRGLLKHFLEPFPHIQHTSIDIAKDLYPDVIGSVTEMPFPNDQFDMVICGQVLERLPFYHFHKALSEIHRVSSRKALLSLPDKRRHFGLGICIARWGWKIYEWNPARMKYSLKPFKFDGQHYWEVGCKGSLGNDIDHCVRRVGFVIEKKYRLLKHDWHCFFLLDASKNKKKALND